MDWRVKALLQAGFSLAPRGEQLNYFVQRYLARSLPVTDRFFTANVSYAKRHIDVIQRYCSRPLAQTILYEFGAGWDMTIAFAFYGFGVESQILVDIRDLIRLPLLNDTINKYQRMGSQLGIPRIPTARLSCTQNSFVTELKERYGIDYRAPCDARQTGMPDQSVYCITSTSTLEHIPERDIRVIMRECHRILRDDG